MTTKTITITDVADLQAGDATAFVITGEPYTGRVREGNGGHLEFAGYIIRYANGDPGVLNSSFVSATREVPELPTEPLSVITNVVTESGIKYPLAVHREFDWDAYSGTGSHERRISTDEIVSFELAKVVPA